MARHPTRGPLSSLKTERTARKTYRMRDEAKADVFDYIERFYNAKRRHSTIGYKSPMEFEMQALVLLRMSRPERVARPCRAQLCQGNDSLDLCVTLVRAGPPDGTHDENERSQERRGYTR